MGRRRGRRRAPFKVKLHKDTLYSVVSVLLLTAAGLIIISFSGQGTFLVVVNSLLSRSFGAATLLIPFLLISAGLMLTQLKWRVARPNVFLGAVLLFIAVLGLGRTGVVGQEIFANLEALVRPIGSWLLLLGTGFIGFMVLTETPLDEILTRLFRLTGLFGKGVAKVKKTGEVGLAGFGQKEMKIKGQEGEEKLGKGDKGGKEEEKGVGDKGGLGTQMVANLPGSEPGVWKLPPLTLLEDKVGGEADRGDVKQNAGIIENTLDHFGIKTHVVEVNLGPAVTQYALEIAPGTKLSKITALQNDLALALAAPTGQIRIEAPIPGRALVGVEIPNRTLQLVPLRRMLTSGQLKKSQSMISFALGLNVSNEPVVTDIARMPHVLVAGATGSGKSVCVNALITTVLFRAAPSEVKFILVDPKRVELTQFNGIPHLLTPVIVDPEKVVSALKWSIAEMERRYKTFAEVGVRNIEGFNELSGFQALPYILIIIDELADIILFAPSEVEDAITRLAQMARATGIHLVLATQRPSVDVLTGLIKANIPCRISFNVTSMVDSRVIIDKPGAEKLLGRGDMLYIPPEQARPTRIQGAFVSEPEIKRVIEYLTQTGVEPQYTEEVTTQYQARKIMGILAGTDEEVDPLFEESVRLVVQAKKASSSLLQRRLSLGYARAARILDQLERAGIVAPPEGSKPRDGLIKSADEYFVRMKSEAN